MKIAYVQMEPVLLEPELNYSRAEELIREAADKGAELVVLPELFDTGYNFRSKAEIEEVAGEIPDGSTTRFLMELSNELDVFIVAGTAEKDEGGGGSTTPPW